MRGHEEWLREYESKRTDFSLTRNEIDISEDTWDACLRELSEELKDILMLGNTEDLTLERIDELVESIFEATH